MEVPGIAAREGRHRAQDSPRIRQATFVGGGHVTEEGLANDLLPRLEVKRHMLQSLGAPAGAPHRPVLSIVVSRPRLGVDIRELRQLEGTFSTLLMDGQSLFAEGDDRARQLYREGVADPRDRELEWSARHALGGRPRDRRQATSDDRTSADRRRTAHSPPFQRAACYSPDSVCTHLDTASSPSSPSAPGCHQAKNSTLPAGPRSGETASPRRPSPRPAAVASTS